MSSKAPMVVSDSPTTDKKLRSQSWDAMQSTTPFYPTIDAQQQYPITMNTASSIPYLHTASVTQLHQWQGNYPPGYHHYNPATFIGGQIPAQMQYTTYGAYNTNAWVEQYRYAHQPTMNTGLAINTGYPATGSQGSVVFPNMVNQSVVLAPSPGKLRKDKQRDISGLPRGPPRKPRQSGHAIWVGSLPVDTSVVALKDHFADGFTEAIESVFVILKSNCAFINYTTEAVCREAVKRFHGSRFSGALLSCRIQKSSVEETKENAELSELEKKISPAMSSESPITLSPTSSTDSDTFSKAATDVDDDQNTMVHEEKYEDKEVDRYFILKSLSIQDLLMSVRFGVWTPQNHNEEALNNAFKTSKNVYLIFSANKSREYFGFARMISPLAADGSSILQSLPVEDSTKDTPKTIKTPATRFAPGGRVFEDAFRGTLFWESDLMRPSSDGPTDSNSSSLSKDRFGGRQFDVQWLSTTRVPFTRTRGLRNSWNSNKEVKVARDGTELEPKVGKQLLELFSDPSIKRQN